MRHWLGHAIAAPIVARADERPADFYGQNHFVEMPTILGTDPATWPPQVRTGDVSRWSRGQTWYQRLLPAAVDMAGLREALRDHLHHVVGRHLIHHGTWERRTRNPFTATRPVTTAEWLRELRWEIWLDHLDALIAAMPGLSTDPAAPVDPAAALMPLDVHDDPIGQLAGVGYGSSEGIHCAEVGDAPVLPRSVFGHGRLPGEGLSWRATLTPEAVPLTRIAGLIVLGGGLLQVRRQGVSFVAERGPGALVEPDEWPRSGGLEMAWRPDPETPGDTLTLTAVHETHVAGLAWLPVSLLRTRVVSRGELGTGAITLMRPAGDHTQTKLVSVSPSTAPVEHRAGSAGPWVRGVPADAALTGTALAAAPVRIRFRAA